MSKRMTLKTNITDKNFAITALKASGLSYEEMGDKMLRITSGSLVHCTIDLTTGNISGDSDTGFRREALGTLRRDYTEAKERFTAARDGVQIKQRLVNKDGSVTLKCRMVSQA
jgi:hypothetical protein